MMFNKLAFSLIALVVRDGRGIVRAMAQEKLRLAWAGFSPTNSPIWVMEDRKLLQKQGVTRRLSRSTPARRCCKLCWPTKSKPPVFP